MTNFSLSEAERSLPPRLLSARWYLKMSTTPEKIVLHDPRERTCVGHITLREELFFVFLSEEEKRSLCLYRVNPLKLPKPELMDYSILLSFVKLVFQVQAFVYSYSNGYKCVRCYKCITVKPWLSTISRQQATPAQQSSYSTHAVSFEYCLLSLNGHLCKTDT